MLTVYVYMKVNGIIKEQSYVVLTDDTRHDKTGSVWASYEKLSKKLDESFPPRTHTIFATDGCAGTKLYLFRCFMKTYLLFTAQFKNFKQFSNLTYHLEEFGHIATWIFSASGHGKSVVDGTY